MLFSFILHKSNRQTFFLQCQVDFTSLLWGYHLRKRREISNLELNVAEKWECSGTCCFSQQSIADDTWKTQHQLGLSGFQLLIPSSFRFQLDLESLRESTKVKKGRKIKNRFQLNKIFLHASPNLFIFFSLLHKRMKNLKRYKVLTLL